MHRAKAFTLVEILAVVGAIALLLGFLLPAMSGVQKRARKAEEINSIRQVGVAWTQYASFNKDMAMPGHLDPEVQQNWRVTYNFPNDSPITDPAVTAPYPWRLLTYLNYDHEIMHAYLNEDDSDLVTEALEVAEEPAFGYNAHYIGGWWTMEGDQPRARFVDKQVVARSPSQIQRSSEVIVFCSSALRNAGLSKQVTTGFPGAAYVNPSTVAMESLWVPHGDPLVLVVIAQSTWVPIGRYTGQSAIVCVDLHTEATAPGSLNDQRRWIHTADSATFTHPN